MRKLREYSRGLNARWRWRTTLEASFSSTVININNNNNKLPTSSGKYVGCPVNTLLHVSSCVEHLTHEVKIKECIHEEEIDTGVGWVLDPHDLLPCTISLKSLIIPTGIPLITLVDPVPVVCLVHFSCVFAKRLDILWFHCFMFYQAWSSNHCPTVSLQHVLKRFLRGRSKLCSRLTAASFSIGFPDLQSALFIYVLFSFSPTHLNVCWKTWHHTDPSLLTISFLLVLSRWHLKKKGFKSKRNRMSNEWCTSKGGDHMFQL